MKRQAEEKFIRANGIQIRYLDWSGESPPILLLHNNRGVADPWKRLVDVTRLSNRFIAPDQRGCGATDKPLVGYSVWDLARDVAGLIDAMELGPVALVGCALGSSIGLAVAANYPEKVSALVMLDSGFPIAQSVIDRSVGVLTAMPHEFASRTEAMAFVRTLPSSLGYSWSPIWEDYFDWTFKELTDGRWAFKFGKEAMLQATGHLADDLWLDAGRVVCPVFVGISSADDIVSAEGGRKLAQVIKNSTFKLLDDVHHLPFLEQDMYPIERLIREYLERVGFLSRDTELAPGERQRRPLKPID